MPSHEDGDTANYSAQRGHASARPEPGRARLQRAQ